MLDVLEYNQLAQQYNNLAPLANTANTIAYSTWYPVAYANGLASGSSTAGAISLSCSPVKQNNFGYLVGCALATTPWCCCLWANIPTLANTAPNSLRIFDSTTGISGVCCEWIVPAGATFARFEIWGAGAASKGNRCCGLTMFGGSGAYASVILPVVPGCSYTLCAGCAEFCCYACTQGSLSSGSGCASFVNGYGLSNFCADGGDPSPGNWLYNASRGVGGGIGGICVLHNNMVGQSTCRKGTYYGMCVCGWGGISWESNQCTTNDVWCRPTVSDRRWYGNLTIPATRSCHFVIGAPGMFACVATASTLDPYRFFSSPPIVNITTTSCASCYIFTTMGGCTSWAAGAYQFPSRGGIGGNVCAGNYSCGLPGAAGLVCVYWV